MDIDIDIKSNFKLKDLFPNIIYASQVNNNDLVKHNCGVYFQKIPIDPITSLSAIPYDKGEEEGLFKIDFLSLPSVLGNFNSKEEILEIMKKPINWDLLLNEDIVRTLGHINGHYDLVRNIKPRSIEELADIISLIRPGKRHLIDQYLKDKEKVRKILYIKENNEHYSYKKSHAIAYAMNITLQMRCHTT